MVLRWALLSTSGQEWERLLGGTIGGEGGPRVYRRGVEREEGEVEKDDLLLQEMETVVKVTSRHSPSKVSESPSSHARSS